MSTVEERKGSEEGKGIVERVGGGWDNHSGLYTCTVV
jgi:hypothetical protein